jgi:hypothetical protein
MKHPCPPQTGLRRRPARRRNERAAFWAGIAIVVAFEAMLMAKFAPPGWSVSDPVAGSDADAGLQSN